MNVTKSKVDLMVFNKTGIMCHTVFKYGDSIMQCVQNYKYLALGLPFSINGYLKEVR